MKHPIYKIFLKLCSIALCCLCLLNGCGQDLSGKQSEHIPTLKILLNGEASGTDRLLAALYSQMDDEHRWNIEITLRPGADYRQSLASSLLAHEDYDLVFDAPWLSLNSMVDKGTYQKLDAYFNDDAYPHLQQAFSAEFLNANKISESIYAIPFTNTYYDPPGFFYRRDILRQLNLGFDSIETHEQMQLFWQAVASAGNLKPITLGTRGFYLLNLPEITTRQAQIWDVAGWSFWCYPTKAILSADGTQVLDVVFAGDEDERFALFDSPFNTNFLNYYFLQNAVFNQYLAENDLLQTNGKTEFLLGTSASFESALGQGGSEQVRQQLQASVPEGEVGFWCYDTALQAENRATQSIPVYYSAWNYLCIPKYSTDPENAMQFLDWLFSDTARLDLFNYGVEGVDWEAIGDTEYRLLDTLEEPFNFPAYEIAWTPTHHRLDVNLPPKEKDLLEYIFSVDSYTTSTLAGFGLDTNKLSIEMARLNAIFAEYYVGLTHGAYGQDTAAILAELHTRSQEAGLETVRAEIIRQLQNFLDARYANS